MLYDAYVVVDTSTGELLSAHGYHWGSWTTRLPHAQLHLTEEGAAQELARARRRFPLRKKTLDVAHLTFGETHGN